MNPQTSTFSFSSWSSTTLHSETPNISRLLSPNHDPQDECAVKDRRRCTFCIESVDKVGIYATPFLKHTGDPGTHALLAFARNPSYLLVELMMLDYSVSAIPPDTWPIPRIFYYLFHKQCIILYLQELAVRLTVNGIRALRKRSWSPFVNTSRSLDKMTRKEIVKIVIFDEVLLWVLNVLCISKLQYRVEGAMEQNDKTQ